MNGEILKKPSTFWIAIGSAIITGSVSFTILTSRVSANEVDIVELRTDLDASNLLLLEVRESQIRIEKDIEFIKSTLE